MVDKDSFLKIIISPPDIPSTKKSFGDSISEILKNDYCDYLHLRLPTASESTIRSILNYVDKKLRNRITLHDHHLLAVEGLAGGVHLNRRNPTLSSGCMGLRVSKSCHSMIDIEKCDLSLYSYVTLSPIFDSISKVDYKSSFNLSELSEALSNFSIPIVALGGIRLNHFSLLKSAGFSGAATLSDTLHLFL